MNRAQIQAAVAELLSITVGRHVTENESVIRDSEPAWDSLKHLELILMLQERFGVQFSEEEMAALSDSDQIVRAVEEKDAP